MLRILLICGFSCASMFTSYAAGARAPDTWDGLFRIRASKADAAYLLPNADFRPYSKVLIDTPQVAFQKDWLRDANSRSHRVTDKEMRQAIDDASAALLEALRTEYGKAGYGIVTDLGSDVLRVSTGIVNLAVAAPDTMSPGRYTVFSQEAGQATLVLEVRDSLSGTLLGRVVDGAIIGDGVHYMRNSVTNRADFEAQFANWAKSSARGLNMLKSNSPIDSNGALRRR